MINQKREIKLEDNTEKLEFAARVIHGLVCSPKRTYFVHFNTDFGDSPIVYVSLSVYELDKYGLFSGEAEDILENVKIPVDVWLEIMERVRNHV